MIQYGLLTAEGTYLPRDGFKRSNGVRLQHPDLWQNQERAIEYASRYSATVVAFVVYEAVVNTGAVCDIDPEFGVDEVTCGAV